MLDRLEKNQASMFCILLVSWFRILITSEMGYSLHVIGDSFDAFVGREIKL